MTKQFNLVLEDNVLATYDCKDLDKGINCAVSYFMHWISANGVLGWSERGIYDTAVITMGNAAKLEDVYICDLDDLCFAEYLCSLEYEFTKNVYRGEEHVKPTDEIVDDFFDALDELHEALNR